MKQHSEFNSEEQPEQSAQAQQAQTPGQEFPSVEAMLRHDALHTPVPPNLAQRLQQSLAQKPAPPRAWWRRWFGGGGA